LSAPHKQVNTAHDRHDAKPTKIEISAVRSSMFWFFAGPSSPVLEESSKFGLGERLYPLLLIIARFFEKLLPLQLAILRVMLVISRVCRCNGCFFGFTRYCHCACKCVDASYAICDLIRVQLVEALQRPQLQFIVVRNASPQPRFLFLVSELHFPPEQVFEELDALLQIKTDEKRMSFFLSWKMQSEKGAVMASGPFGRGHRFCRRRTRPISLSHRQGSCCHPASQTSQTVRQRRGKEKHRLGEMIAG
jgi:hypothetical protein